MATAAKSPEPWEETGDSQVPFDDLLNQLSESRSSKHLPSLSFLNHISSVFSNNTTILQSLQRRVDLWWQEEWKRIPTIGRELDPSTVSALLGPSPDPFVRPERSKGWPASWEHSGSAFGRFGYLPHCDLVPWDVERAKAPERSWPADGAVCRLYDGKRKEKAAWKPTTWKHHGPSFPAVPSLATSLSTPALRSLQRKASKTAKERVRGRSDSRASEEIERARSADRMLDMGFIDTVKALIGKMPKAGKRQTCMFSATWPATVHALATKFLSQPVHVGIGSVEEGLVANTAIRQVVEVIKNEKEKPTRLLHYLKKHFTPDKKVIIFGLYKKEIAWLETFLWEKGYEKVIALQGDMSQDKRTQALADFKATKKTPLIATDVAGRGLDVQDVELVINYTFPLTIEEYTHRIGRTGRAGKKGLAICFFCPDSKGAQDEKAHAGDLCAILRKANQEVPKELESIANTSGGNKATKKKAHPLFGAHFKSAEQMAALEAKKVHTTFDSDED
eukprot:s1341_g6.t1